ncbi:MAG: OmpH family outer membrane protein [Bdellovibrionales bacterium]
MGGRLSAAVALWLLSAAGSSFAAEPSLKPLQASAVAIVDVQRILQSSHAAKSVQSQLETQRSKFQTEIAAEEMDLREAERKLTKLRETAKANDYVEQEQKLQQRFLSVERHVQARRKALDQGYTDSMNVVRKALIDIVADIAKKKRVNLVIVKQQVIWNDSVIDITDEVLARLDEAMPNVQFSIQPEDDFLPAPAPIKTTKGDKKGK